MREPRNRVVQVRRFGGPDELEVVDAPLPTAGRDEVRVRVLASSVEYTDVVIRRPLYPWVFRRPPFVMGYDVVGEIDELGDDVSGLHLGDRVADMTVPGSNTDLDRLRGLTANAYAMARANASRIRPAIKAVDCTLNELGIDLRAAEPATGYIRHLWQVTLSTDACHLDAY
jgi:NADPH:quinone reductase-like Zn-dependent oxidoreductase